MLADLVDLHDVRVLQPGDHLRLGAKPRQALGAGVAGFGDPLQGDQPAQAWDQSATMKVRMDDE